MIVCIHQLQPLVMSENRIGFHCFSAPVNCVGCFVLPLATLCTICEHRLTRTCCCGISHKFLRNVSLKFVRLMRIGDE